MIDDPFELHRDLLFTVAYEMLGSVGDAEDVVQEAWLRWATHPRDDVADPRAYAVRIVTRLALNHLRTLSRRRETYVGPWLPEPVLTSPDVAEDVVLADSVSMAMLVVLETLGPVERAVFCLREVFGHPYEEIAQAVDRTPAAVRQIAHRARAHVAARRPRPGSEVPDPAAVTEQFLHAARTGELGDLLELIAPDVVLVTDGGGVRRAALRPIVGVDKVLRFMLAVTDPQTTLETTQANGEEVVLARTSDGVDAVLSLEFREGLISRIFVVRNPAKLARLDRTRGLALD